VNAREAFRLRPDLRMLALCASITLAAWIALIRAIAEIRYVLFLWVLLYIVAAQVLDGAMDRRERSIRALSSAILIALLAYMAARTTVNALDTYSPVDAAGRARCYDVPMCRLLDPLNETAAPGERVLVLNSYRSYMRPDLFACSSRADEFLALGALARASSPEFWTEAYRRGFGYIAYEPHYAVAHSGFGRLPDPGLAPDWLRVAVFTTEPRGQVAYRIQAIDPPFPPQRSCVRSAEGAWSVQRTE
jgi:hypothetical protein